MADKLPASEIRFLIEESNFHADEMLMQQLRQYNPIDIAETLRHLDEAEKVRIVNALPAEDAALVLDETDAESRNQILAALDAPAISDLVEEMPPDEGADILQQLPDDKVEDVLDDMENEVAAELKELREYPADTAGGMMTPDFIWADVDGTAGETLARVREDEEAEHVSEIYALDRDKRLVGMVKIKRLLEQFEDTRVGDFMDPEPIRITFDTDQEDVVNVVQKYNLPSLPVVDATGVLKGLITHDDAMDVMEEEADEDIFRIAGTTSRGVLGEPVRRKYIKRLPFLLTTFLGGAMTILIQYFFRLTTEELVAITFFIPIINGLSGNVGLQASTIMVRGFATGEIELSRVFRLLPREVATGFLIGLTFGVLCGLVTALAAEALSAKPYLGLAVGVSMCCGTTVASLLGTLVPSMCERIGIDPAVSAGPFIATLLDSTALVIYLGIATSMLQVLRLNVAV